jgi:cell division inhibitor SepF
MGAMNSVLTFFGFGPGESTSTETAAKPRVAAARRRAGDMSEIVTLDPQSYADGKEVAANFRQGIPVIVNIAALSESDASKMFHFMIGLKEGLEGQMKRVTPKVFLLTPAHVAISDNEDDAEINSDLMN